VIGNISKKIKNMRKIILIVTILMISISCSDDTGDCIAEVTTKYLEQKRRIEREVGDPASKAERLRQLERQKDKDIADCY